MGNSYVNYTLRGPDQQKVAQAMAGRRSLVTPVNEGCVVVFDEVSDQQDMDVIADLASRLSRELACSVLAVLNHDDDILRYQLYEHGELADEYDSAPDYFDAAAEPSAPSGGDARKLCAAFGVSDVDTVEKILRPTAFEPGGFPFAVLRHAALVEALGTSQFALGAGYTYLQAGDYPDDLSPSDVISTQ